VAWQALADKLGVSVEAACRQAMDLACGKVAKVVEALIADYQPNPDTVEITVEIDSQRNILRAVATGATELRTKNLNEREKTEDELSAIVRESAGAGVDHVEHLAQTGGWHAFSVVTVTKSLFGLLKKKNSVVCVVDSLGVIRLQKSNAGILTVQKRALEGKLSAFIDEMTTYNDGGALLPRCYLYFRQKAVDLSGVMEKEQLLPLIRLELEFVDDDEPLLIVAAKS
jgi:hypothetical protein